MDYIRSATRWKHRVPAFVREKAVRPKRGREVVRYIDRILAVRCQKHSTAQRGRRGPKSSTTRKMDQRLKHDGHVVNEGGGSNAGHPSKVRLRPHNATRHKTRSKPRGNAIEASMELASIDCSCLLKRKHNPLPFNPEMHRPCQQVLEEGSHIKQAMSRPTARRHSLLHQHPSRHSFQYGVHQHQRLVSQHAGSPLTTP